MTFTPGASGDCRLTAEKLGALPWLADWPATSTRMKVPEADRFLHWIACAHFSTTFSLAPPLGSCERKIGAVGVSGLPGEVDEQLAIASIESSGER